MRGGSVGPWVPAGEVAELLRPKVEQTSLRQIADQALTSERALFRIMHGESGYVTYDLVDQIVCKVFGDPSLWVLLTIESDYHQVFRHWSKPPVSKPGRRRGWVPSCTS
jgi:hypothetical protein